jgi:hypothetical protein
MNKSTAGHAWPRLSGARFASQKGSARIAPDTPGHRVSGTSVPRREGEVFLYVSSR